MESGVSGLSNILTCWLYKKKLHDKEDVRMKQFSARCNVSRISWSTWRPCDLTSKPQDDLIKDAPSPVTTVVSQLISPPMFPLIYLLIFPWLCLCTILSVFGPLCRLAVRLALVVFSVPPAPPQLLEGFKHIEGIKGFGPRVASSSHPCAWFLLCLLVSTVPALLFLPMCKWLHDRAERKHELCFLDTEHARNSSGLTAVRIHQIHSGEPSCTIQVASLFVLFPTCLVFFFFSLLLSPP